MINAVATNDIPYRTKLGGTCCTPRTFRVSINTIDIFKKQVLITRSNGIREAIERINNKDKGWGIE